MKLLIDTIRFVPRTVEGIMHLMEKDRDHVSAQYILAKFAGKLRQGLEHEGDI